MPVSEEPDGHRVTGVAGQDHRVRRPAIRAGAVAGAAAAAVAAGLGTVMLVTVPSPAPSPARSAGPTAERITVSTTAPNVPLSGPAILRLLGEHPDLGLLGDGGRRGSCLNGLGYPASEQVLGGQQLHLDGRPVVLLVLAGDTPRELHALVVPPSCSSADTGLIADTQIPRP